VVLVSLAVVAMLGFTMPLPVLLVAPLSKVGQEQTRILSVLLATPLVLVSRLVRVVQRLPELVPVEERSASPREKVMHRRRTTITMD
jgi:hypothetical protein